MRAKTIKNLILKLLAIISIVFAISLGSTYASNSFILNVGSNPNSTTTYLTNQECVLINDTTSTPIAFGLGTRLTDVSVQYSYGYDFDIRLTYSLAWSGGASTDNVILRFVDRDNLIVDNNYIYYTGPVSAGSGILRFISGVDFVDPYDSTYDGQSLTITASVDVYKAQSSYDISTNELTKDVQTSESAKAWIRYKNRSTSSNAYAIVYNLRATYENGVEYPGAESAYSRQYNTSNIVTNSTWLGGNRAYGGMGLYLITGSTAYTLKVKVTGAWYDENGTITAFVYTNNILFNYASNWNYFSESSDGVFDYYTYNFTIPANTAVYIELVDGIEITCKARFEQSVDEYEGRRIRTKIEINDTTFDNFTNGIQSLDGLSNSDITASNNYSKPDTTIYNSTLYNPALYYENNNQGGEQNFYGSASIVNNTADTQKLTLSYSINVYISNGSPVVSGDGTLWARGVISSSSSTYFSITNQLTTIVLAPYSSINLFDKFSLTIKDLIVTNYSNSDAWVEIIVSSSSNTTATSQPLQVDVGIRGTNYVLTLKNNTNVSLTNFTVNLNVVNRTKTYTLTTGEPNNWLSNYWEYYIKVSDNVYERVTTYSAWTANTYYLLTYGSATPSSLSVSTKNDFSYSASTLTNTTLTLYPGESVVMATIAKPSNEYVFTTSASASSSSASGAIAILFNGTTDAYIYNDTTNSYYVRFTGTLLNELDYISSINNYNYYIDIVRPGQIIKLPMTTKGTLETSLATDTYSWPSGWDAIDSAFKSLESVSYQGNFDDISDASLTDYTEFLECKKNGLEGENISIDANKYCATFLDNNILEYTTSGSSITDVSKTRLFD